MPAERQPRGMYLEWLTDYRFAHKELAPRARWHDDFGINEAGAKQLACYRNIWALAEEVSDMLESPELSSFDEVNRATRALRGVLNKNRHCDFKVAYAPGRTPEAHLALEERRRDMRAQLAWHFAAVLAGGGIAIVAAVVGALLSD